MEIDFSQGMKNFDGTVATDREKPLTLGAVSTEALLAVFQDEQSLPGEEKAKRYELAMRILKGGRLELSVEEAAELKRLIGKAFAPLIVGQAFRMIEGKTEGQP